jgi:hypothetical protein
MKFQKGNNANPKGNPATLVPGPKEGWKPKPVWGGPTEDQWYEFLAAVSDGKHAKHLVKEWEVDYGTFLAWRERNPERNAEFEVAIRAKVEGYEFDMQAYADGEMDSTADSNIKVARNTLQIKFRENFLKAYHNKWKPKQDINVTGLTDDELRRQLESEIAALVGRSEEAGD